MKRRIDLNEGWRLTWTEFAGDRPPAEPKRPAPDIPAAVPGDVHLDLMRADLLGDLYVGMNLDHAAWVERKDFWYRKRFETPADLAGRAALLVFHGLDTFATVWLNGRLLGRTDNMFRRYEFDVTDALAPSGGNDLTVRLAAPAYSIEVDGGHGPVEWSPERLFARKAQMSFGWDIAPRLVTAGIWRPVELVLIDTARITDAHVTHDDPTADAVRVRVEVEVEWLAGSPGTGRVGGRIHDTPFELSADFAPGANVVAAEVVLPNPPLWWPIGYGKPALCDLQVRLESAGRELDSYEARIGIRRIELVREPQPSGAESFGFRCNGRKLFITGLNWTPLDAIFARITPERITRTLEALAGIGCNMLRVWGGGIYEPRHFYDECDRLGIMVWQDFMMACGWYPQTDEFAERLSAEARHVVRDLRNHPCLAAWAGDNEVDAFYPELAGQNRLTRDLLAGICRELDPDTVYLPSSPYSPSGADPQNQAEGDVHHYAHGECYRKCRLWDLRARFVSEFGHLSLPSLEVIGRYFPPGTAWPLTSPTWRYHAADTIREPRFRGAEKILESLAACGRAAPGGIEEAVEASQELQAQAVCAWIERWCEDPEFGGFLIWNVADCWPQQSDSVIDCDGNPKRIFDRLGPLFERMRRRHVERAEQ